MNQIIIHGQEADQLPKAADISKTNPYDKRITRLCLEFPHPKKHALHWHLCHASSQFCGEQGASSGDRRHHPKRPSSITYTISHITDLQPRDFKLMTF